jgi:uncharacterized protein
VIPQAVRLPERPPKIWFRSNRRLEECQLIAMRCPICKRETPYEGNPYRPFCSERCRWLDLDNWLEGRYRIPDATGASEEDHLDNLNEGADEDDS